MMLSPQNEDLAKTEHFAVGVTDAAKGKFLPFGSNRNDEPFFPAVLVTDSSKRTKCPLTTNRNNVVTLPDSLQIMPSDQNDHLATIVTLSPLLLNKSRYR